MALMKQYKQSRQQDYYYSALVTSDPEETKAKNPSWEIMKTRRSSRKRWGRRSAGKNDVDLNYHTETNTKTSNVRNCAFDRLSFRNCEFNNSGNNSQRQSDHHKGGNNLHESTSLAPTSNLEISSDNRTLISNSLVMSDVTNVLNECSSIQSDTNLESSLCTNLLSHDSLQINDINYYGEIHFTCTESDDDESSQGSNLSFDTNEFMEDLSLDMEDNYDDLLPRKLCTIFEDIELD